MRVSARSATVFGQALGTPIATRRAATAAVTESARVVRNLVDPSRRRADAGPSYWSRLSSVAASGGAARYSNQKAVRHTLAWKLSPHGLEEPTELGAPLPFAVDPCLHTWLDPQYVERSVTDAPELAVVVRARPLIPEPAGATERIEPVGSYHACTARP